VGAFWIVTIAVAAWGLPFALTRAGVPPQSIVRFLMNLLWAGLVVAFRAALLAVVYLELRVRKEGYDLQTLLSALPSAA
jgi:hypothetical protein